MNRKHISRNDNDVSNGNCRFNLLDNRAGWFLSWEFLSTVKGVKNGT